MGGVAHHEDHPHHHHVILDVNTELATSIREQGMIQPLIVRQADAHAWAEIWVAQEGWVRIDPTGLEHLGNGTPVLVDDTACMKRAAKSIIQGAAYDNNLLCIGEKEVFVLDHVADKFMASLQQAGARLLSEAHLEKLTGVAFTDALPAGVQVAGTPAFSSTCGGTVAPGQAGAISATLSVTAFHRSFPEAASRQ